MNQVADSGVSVNTHRLRAQNEQHFFPAQTIPILMSTPSVYCCGLGHETRSDERTTANVTGRDLEHASVLALALFCCPLEPRFPREQALTCLLKDEKPRGAEMSHPRSGPSGPTSLLAARCVSEARLLHVVPAESPADHRDGSGQPRQEDPLDRPIES